MSETPERAAQPKKSLDEPITRREALMGALGFGTSVAIGAGILGKLTLDRYASNEEKNQMLQRVNEELSHIYGQFVEKNISKFIDPKTFDLARTAIFAKDLSLDPLTIQIGIFYYEQNAEDQMIPNEIGNYTVVLQKGEAFDHDKHVAQPVWETLKHRIPQL